MTPSEANAAKRTPLYGRHVALGARMAPFGGYDMPIQYSGIVAEHQACRTGATIFDTCHMGEFRLGGKGAVADLDRLVSCSVADLAIGRCRYGLLCDPSGGVRDDLIVYREKADGFMVVVNAGTQDDDFDWISGHLSGATRIENLSAMTAKLDLQGPRAPRLLSALLGTNVPTLPYFGFIDLLWRGGGLRVSRTGYTGEIGFELYGTPETIQEAWDGLLAQGAIPAGLGARDTLRLEAGLPLYGHELSRDRNGAEAGLDRSIAGAKDFIGCAALRDPARRRQRLTGIRLEDRRSARQGDSVLDAAGHVIGTVTSGSFAPTLGIAVALAYVNSNAWQSGASVRLRTARAELPGQLQTLPFHAGTARRPLSEFL